MAASVGQLEVSLGADIARLRRDLGRATWIAEKRARAMQNTFKKAAGVIGASFAGLSFGALIKGIADTGDRFQKLSISLGVSTEAMSQYRLVAERSGTTMESLALIWQRQTRRVAEAAQGTGEARNALRELGLQADDLAKLAPDKQFEAIAEAMKGVENQADKLRIAFKLYDSEGARPALQIMSEGAAAIRSMRKEADAMGLTMTRLQSNQMAEFNDRLTDAKLAITGASQQLVLSLAPSIISVAKGFAEGVKWVSKFIDSLRSVENRSNLQGLQEQLQALTDESERLQQSIEARAGRSGRNGPAVLRRQYAAVRAEIESVTARIEELKKQSEEAGGIGAVADITTTPGSLPSIEDDKAAEREAEKQQRMKEALASKVEALRESLLTEEQLEIESFERKAELLAEAVENRVLTEEAAANALELIAAKHQANMTALEQKGQLDRQKLQQKSLMKQTKDFASFTRQAIGTAANSSKTLFKISKLAAIAEGILSMRESIMTAYKFGSKFGGPPLGAAMAAIAGAAQLANLNSLRQSEFGGGGGGGGAPSAVGGAIGTFPADPVFGIPEEPQQQPATTNITINLGDEDGLLPRSSVRNLINQINEEIGDGVVLGGITVS